MFSRAPSQSVSRDADGQAEMQRSGDSAQDAHPQIDLRHARGTEACCLLADLIDQSACDRHLMHGSAPLSCARAARSDALISQSIHPAMPSPLLRRHLQHFDVGIDRPRMLDAAGDIEVEMRQQVDL